MGVDRVGRIRKRGDEALEHRYSGGGFAGLVGSVEERVLHVVDVVLRLGQGPGFLLCPRGCVSALRRWLRLKTRHTGGHALTGGEEFPGVCLFLRSANHVHAGREIIGIHAQQLFAVIVGPVVVLGRHIVRDVKLIGDDGHVALPIFGQELIDQGELLRRVCGGVDLRQRLIFRRARADRDALADLRSEQGC